VKPTAGARYLLELQNVDGTSATYRATIFTPDAEHAAIAVLDESGTVSVTPHDDTLEMFAKLTARGAAKRREDGLPPWPQRVLRWRGPGRGE
jgi:hypothetical protein